MSTKGPAKQDATTLHVPISAELQDWLDKMRKQDRRGRNDFLRILIEDEWHRRQKVAAGNGAAS